MLLVLMIYADSAIMCWPVFNRAHQLALEFFSQKNGSTQHTIFAVGNCHIDTGTMLLNILLLVIIGCSSHLSEDNFKN